MITQEQLKELFHYDPNTGTFTHLTNTQPHRYSAHDRIGLKIIGATTISIKLACTRSYPAHHLAWLYMTGELPTLKVRRKNGEKWDNRFCNLELIPLPGDKKPRYKAYVEFDGKSYPLGKFKTKAEATKAATEACLNLISWRIDKEE